MDLNLKASESNPSKIIPNSNSSNLMHMCFRNCPFIFNFNAYFEKGFTVKHVIFALQNSTLINSIIMVIKI
jgi:hypothetical protein